MRALLIRACAFARFVLIACLSFFLLVEPALASSVSLAPVYAFGNQLVTLLLQGLAAAFAAWTMWAFHKYVTPYLGDQVEAKFSRDLNTALANGAPIVLHQLGAWESVHTSIDVQNEVTAGMARYALKYAPEAVAHFGLSPANLVEKALAFVPPAPSATPAAVPIGKV